MSDERGPGVDCPNCQTTNDPSSRFCMACGSPLAAADPAPVADATCFLLSDLARAVTGEVLHVDGGYHALAAPGVRAGMTQNAGSVAGQN